MDTNPVRCDDVAPRTGPTLNSRERLLFVAKVVRPLSVRGSRDLAVSRPSLSPRIFDASLDLTFLYRCHPIMGVYSLPL